MRLLPISLALAAFSLVSQANAAPTPPNLSSTQFQQCLDGLKNSSNFKNISSATFEQYRPTQPDPSVIVALNYQPEFQKPVWDYLSGLVDEERVADGIAAKNQHQTTLTRIEQRYGVKAEDVLGVWGVESNFGKQLGKKDLIQSLATLSCFDRRQSYFRTEYANALRILQNGDIRREDMTGSWAGAFGHTQFMPSTFLRIAVDFDGDGKRDLVDNVPDALASTANFLRKAGYVTGEPWGYEVKLPAGFVPAVSGRKNRRGIDYWAAQGLTLPNGRALPRTLSSAGLLLPAGAKGPAFLVGKNFDTLYSYNASENYALAIAHLSDLLTSNSDDVAFATAWPTDDAGLSRAENRELQTLLLARGHDIGQPDGLIGAKTRQAIRAEQGRLGMPVNGRGGQKLLGALRSK